MQITVNREQFAGIFTQVAGLAPTRSPKAVLEYVKMTVKDGTLSLCATDLETFAVVSMDDGFETTQEGSVLLHVVRTRDILGASSSEFLTFDLNEHIVQVTGDRSKFRLPTQNADEYPSQDIQKFEKYHTFKTQDLLDLINFTVYCCDAESSRFALGGVMFELHNNSTVIAVGTDGRRIARAKCGAQVIGDQDKSDGTLIVPARAAQTVAKIIANGGDTVDVYAGTNSIYFSTEKAFIGARMLEGKFPAWRKVFEPTEQAVDFAAYIDSMATSESHSAFRQAAIVLDHESRGIDLVFGGDQLTLKSSTAEIGESDITMPIEMQGDAVTVTLDHRYVNDFFKSLGKQDEFSVKVKDATSPVLFDSNEQDFTYAVMPMSRDR